MSTRGWIWDPGLGPFQYIQHFSFPGLPLVRQTLEGSRILRLEVVGEHDSGIGMGVDASWPVSILFGIDLVQGQPIARPVPQDPIPRMYGSSQGGVVMTRLDYAPRCGASSRSFDCAPRCVLVRSL